MTQRRTICAITGSRADYGYLYCILQSLKADADFELKLVVTGSHLYPEFGSTAEFIEKDGFEIAERVELPLPVDTRVAVAKAMASGVSGIAEALNRLCPDLVLIVGDRYEIFAAAQAALILAIPVAHIAGGDTTEGAYDEALRHSITKMSHLHFVTNEDSARRVRQLGENPTCVFNVGSPSLDYILRLRLLNRGELAGSLGCVFREKNILITFHPVTLGIQSSAQQFQELLDVLSQYYEKTSLFFTRPNADNDGRVLNSMLDHFLIGKPYAFAFASLGQERYLSLVNQVDVVVGNSSSGLYEVPSFKKPAVNIGDRQRGRLSAESVINVEADSKRIFSAIERALTMDCSKVENPYGDGGATERIISALKSIPDFRGLLQKSFFDVASNI